MADKQLEIRTFTFRADPLADEPGVFSGIAITYETYNPLYNEIFKRGAFKKSINDNSGIFPLIADHFGDHIGYITETVEESKGVRVKGKLALEVKSASEKYALMKQADSLKKPYGLSVGFRAIKSAYESSVNPNTSNTRVITEAALHEISLTPFPAYGGALVQQVRDRIRERIDERWSETDDEIKYRVADFEDFFINSFATDAMSEQGGMKYLMITGARSATTRDVVMFRFPKSQGWTLELAQAYVLTETD